jgi:hypothetical protein
MSGVVDAVRWCVLGRPPPSSSLLISAVVIVFALGGSVFYFRRVERTLVDRL